MSFTNEQIIEAARAAVAEKGADYVYVKPGHLGCVYATQDHEPSCIVGHVVAALDPEMFEELFQAERSPEGEDTGIDALADELDLDFTPSQVVALKLAQVAQDQGKPWAEALVEIETLETA